MLGLKAIYASTFFWYSLPCQARCVRPHTSQASFYLLFVRPFCVQRSVWNLEFHHVSHWEDSRSWGIPFKCPFWVEFVLGPCAIIRYFIAISCYIEVSHWTIWFSRSHRLDSNQGWRQLDEKLLNVRLLFCEGTLFSKFMNRIYCRSKSMKLLRDHLL